MLKPKKMKSEAFRTRLADIVADIQEHDAEYILERYNTPVAVIISYERWQKLNKRQEKSKSE